uniref:Uncharacterized protein n=1 Tax=Tanacetum cinerariifolium TaxID=118510 RepID=A0A6L2LCR5_TANCI|nr:hypothetical protein [Tanacetum cinerariifolium]
MNLVPKELIQVVVPSAKKPWGTTAQIRFKRVSKHSNVSLLASGNTLRSDEDSLKLDKLMALCTTLRNKVLDLEKTTTTRHNEIASLKKRVKKLKKRNRSRTHGLKRVYKVGLSTRVESSGNEESLGPLAHWIIKLFFKPRAQALEALKTSKPKVKGIVFQEPERSIRLDEEAAKKLQAKFDEEERLAREKAKKEERANIALIEVWDDIQVKIDANHQLAERLQA